MLYKSVSKILLINTNHNKLNLPKVRTTHYGFQSKKCKSTKAWSEIRTKVSEKLNIGYWTKSKLSKSLKKYYLNNGILLFGITFTKTADIIKYFKITKVMQ